MKWTKSLIQTLRENPGDAEIDSHKLLIRAGLARKVAGGLYAYLPLGMRSLRKIQQIVRDEPVYVIEGGRVVIPQHVFLIPQNEGENLPEFVDLLLVPGLGYDERGYDVIG